MTNDYLSIIEAASALEMDLSQFITYRQEKDIPFETAKGKLYFERQTILEYKLREEAIGREKADEEEAVQEVKTKITKKEEKRRKEKTKERQPKSPEKKAERQELPRTSVKDFILDYVRDRRKSKDKGVHSVWSKLNKKIRSNYDCDPVETISQLESEGVLITHPFRGGALLYEDTPEIREKLAMKTRQKKASESYDYPNKNNWRKKSYEFEDEHLEIGEETRVLILPGPEAMEVPYYLARGVKPENIDAVERIIPTARRVQKAYPGVNVVNREVKNHLRETKRRYDIIRLDYDGKISEETIHTLELIVQRQLLKERSVLGINLFGKRETIDQQLLYLEPRIQGELNLNGPNGDGVENEKGTVRPGKDNPKINASERTINDVRDYGITALMLKMFMGRDTGMVNRKLLNALDKKERQHWENYLKNNLPKRYIDFIKTNDEIRFFLESNLGNAGQLRKLALILQAAESRPYFISGISRMKYKTEHGNNIFFSDFFALHQRRDLFALLDSPVIKRYAYGKQKLVNFLTKYGSLKRRERSDLNHLIRESYEEIANGYDSFFISEQTPERINVNVRVKAGKSGKASKRKKTRKRRVRANTKDVGPSVFRMLDEGKSDEEIFQVLPELTKMKLAGHKAHRTRKLRKESNSGES